MNPTDVSDSVLLTAYDLITIAMQLAPDPTAALIETAAAQTQEAIVAALNARGYHLVCQMKSEVDL